MKIQLDFNCKEITLESNVNLKLFFDQIKTLLPDWKEWKLSTNNTIYWSNPIPWTWQEPFNPFWTNPNPITYTTNGDGQMVIDMSKQPIPDSVNVYCLDVN